MQHNSHMLIYYLYLESIGKAPYWFDSFAMHCEGYI